MTPFVARRGHSFAGAGQYYLHDKGKDSNERVQFSHTLNLATNDAEKAMKYMAYTAMNAEQRKRDSGVALTGRQSTEGVVYAFSLSWHPEQHPSEGDMTKAACGAIDALRLGEHEIVIVGHNDTEHPHVHVIVNLVHPDTGKIGNIFKDRHTLSEWAYGYEQDNGGVICTEREKRYGSDGEGSACIKKPRDHAHDRKRLVSRFYECAKDYSDFTALLGGEGLTLAQGDKSRLVIVGVEGEIINLARCLPKGVNSKQIKAQFAGLDVGALPDATALSQARQQIVQEATYEPEIAYEPNITVLDESETPLKAHIEPSRDEVSDTVRMHQQRASRALSARRNYQERQALHRVICVEAITRAYQPDNHRLRVSDTARVQCGHAMACLRHYREKLVQQPVGMMQQLGQTMQRYRQHVQSLWDSNAGIPPKGESLHVRSVGSETPPLKGVTTIQTRNHALERSIGSSRNDCHGMDL